MTSTRFNVGLSDTRNSSKVLKPPGGGSSNIFGAPDVPEASPRRRNQSHLQSSVLAGTDMATPARVKPDGNPVTGEGYVTTNGDKSAPIGDVPSAPVVNGSASQESAAPASASAPTQSNNTQPRSRVPPGGFSSGLW